MRRTQLTESVMARFMRGPVSVRSAARVIVVFTLAVVVVSGVLMRVVDGDEYPNVWRGMWWALQTVTTIGYGDVTPQETSGRILAAVVMLEGVAFLTVVVAAITSYFVARERQDRDDLRAAADGDETAKLHARFDALDERLNRLESLLSRPTDG